MSEYISREEFEKRIKPYDTSDRIDKALYNFAHNTLICCSSADVRENIHARWESDGHGHIICTACKGAKLNTHRSKFCDSCGAIMDGEVEPKGEKGTE